MLREYRPYQFDLILRVYHTTGLNGLPCFIECGDENPHVIGVKYPWELVEKPMHCTCALSVVAQSSAKVCPKLKLKHDVSEPQGGPTRVVSMGSLGTVVSTSIRAA
jgi:hypothetical protein